jgi:hypothetical protein
MGEEASAADPARGALVVVYRRRGDVLEYLLLRRTGALGGDWAWGPPAGERVVDFRPFRRRRVLPFLAVKGGDRG